MAIDSSSGFWSQASHIFLQIHKTQPRGWRKRTNEQTRTWVKSKRKKGKVYNTFVQLSVHLQAIVGVYFARNFHKATRNAGSSLDCLLPSSHYLLLPTVSFSGQLSQADRSLRPSFVNPLSLSSLRLSFPPPLLLLHSCPLCGFRTKTDKEILRPAPT